MRRTLITLTAFGLLLSCNNDDTIKVVNDTTSVKQQSDITASENESQKLIDELKKLQIIVASQDKEQIAGIFQFTLADTTIGIYLDDSIYNAQLEVNGNEITRAMFLRFFPQISESLQINELNQLLKTIRLDSLQQKDILEHELLIKNEPCYKYYCVEVKGNMVTLTTGQNVNSNFVSSKSSEEDVPENSSEFCESVLWWVFRFDGKKLHFIKQHGAG